MGRDFLPLKLQHLLQAIRDCLTAGRVIYTAHALEEMVADGISHMEVRQVLRVGRHRSEKDFYDDAHKAWNYRIHGFTAGGERELGVVVSFDERTRLLIVTAFELGVGRKV